MNNWKNKSIIYKVYPLMIDPWGTPASTGDLEDDWPFNKTLWNLFDRKFSMHFRGKLDISKDYSL